jgi:Pentapeptide repeats (8 copies)
MAEDWIGKRQWIPEWTSFHDLLFHGQVDETSRRRKSLFSNTLVLPAFDGLEAAKIDDPKKLDTINHTLILRGRHLESADFVEADLRKADLEDAQLQGATLDRAQLQGASLPHAQLQGASLYGAQLQGASLSNTRLQGAFLRAAKFQGADFTGSTFAGTNMSGAAVWRANFDNASLTAIFEDDLKETTISRDEFADLQAMIMKEVPEGEKRANALKSIEKLNPDIFGPDASAREILEKRSVGKTAYNWSLADQLKSLACSGDEDALYIVRGLVTNGRIEATVGEAPGLVEAILNPKAAKDCPVSAALTDADKAALNKLAEEAQAPEGKP